MPDIQEITKNPTAKSAIVESEELMDQELFLYDQGTGAVHTLNGGAAMVWLLCDGERDLEEISQEIAFANGGSWQQVLPQVQQIVGQFHGLGLLEE